MVRLQRSEKAAMKRHYKYQNHIMHRERLKDMRSEKYLNTWKTTTLAASQQETRKIWQNTCRCSGDRMCLKNCPSLEKLSRGASLFICSIFIVLKDYLIKQCIGKNPFSRSKKISWSHDVTEYGSLFFTLRRDFGWVGGGFIEYDEISLMRKTSQTLLPICRTSYNSFVP